MRKILAPTIALLFLGVFGSGQNSKQDIQQRAEKGPCDTARTQRELSECSVVEFHKADAQLNSVYAKLMKEITKGSHRSSAAK
jgi:uncharacterized protein YecT (DUF1311 family)